jgi:hypothetical protein
VPNTGDISIAEAGSACWLTPDRLLLGGVSEENENPNDEALQTAEHRLNARGIAIYDVVSRTYARSVIIGETPGTLMPIGEKHAVCFYQHPKLVSLETGEILARWEDIDSGMQASSIHDGKLPPIALDPANHRFAVFGEGGIHVIQIDLQK